MDGYALLGVYWNLSKHPTGVPYVINPSKAVKKYELSEAAGHWTGLDDVSLNFEKGSGHP
ncbi:MAG: hypothetical protein ABWW66_00415 [Archaeoglobaceae archaeon]